MEVEKLKEIPRAFGFGSALAPAVAVASSESTDGATAVANIVPYRIVFKLCSDCKLTGSLWSVVLGCGASSHHVRCVTGRGCVEDRGRRASGSDGHE